MTKPGPFYPCQLDDGSTHVVDGRTERVVWTVTGTPDTIERWSYARKSADRRNVEYHEGRAALRGLTRVLLGVVIILAIVAALVLGT